MKPMKFKEQFPRRGIAFLLAVLIAPALFGDDKNTSHHSGGQNSKPTRQAPQHSTPAPASRQAPAPQVHQNPTPQVHQNPTPQGHQPSNLPAGNTNNNYGRPPANVPNRQPSGNPPNNGGRTFGGNNTPNNNGGRTFGGNNNAPRQPQTFHAPPGATMSRRSDGGASYTHNGMNYNTDRNGHLSSISRPGMQARFAPNGGVRAASFDRPGGAHLNVQHGFYGERRVETIRPDHSRIVSYGPGRGFVERPLARRGYVSRTYVYGGVSTVRVYRTYSYRGVAYYGYVPPVYYHPVFYGWAYNPWPRPIAFGWGFRASPWFGFYGGFFAPAPMYPTASLWLTDYMLSEDLRMAYDNRQAAIAAQQQQPAQYGQYDQPPPAPADPNGQVMLTPAVKQAIAEEVRQQIDAERAAANQPGGAPPPPMNAPPDQAPAALDPKQRIFVVSSSFAVNSAGQDCGLTPGDIIVRTSDQVSATNTVNVSVLSSKPGDCAMNAMADVEVATLQEMHNQFQDHVDSGLKQLASNEGKDGLPPGPPPQPQASPDGVAPPDSAQNVQAALQQQQQDANQALSEVQQSAGTN